MKKLSKKSIKNKYLAIWALVSLALAACTQGGVGTSVGDPGSPGGTALDGPSAEVALTNQAAGPAERPPVTLAGEQIPREFFEAYCKEVGKDENGEAIYECDFGQPDWQRFPGLAEIQGLVRLRLKNPNEYMIIPQRDTREQFEIRDEAAQERLQEIFAERGRSNSDEENEDSDEESEFRFRRVEPLYIPSND